MKLPQSMLRVRLDRPARRSVPLRAFSSARSLRIKEDADRSAQEIEMEKQENLKKPEWNRELASSSEEVVGAENESVKDHDKHIDKLQKQTAQKAEEKHPQGRS